MPTASPAQDPAAELAAVQAEADALRQQIADTEQRLAAAETAAKPEVQAYVKANARANQAEDRATELANELSATRDAAAAEIEGAEQAYEDDLASAEDTRSGGFTAAVLAVVIALIAYGLGRWRGWKLPRWATIAGAAVLALLFVGGIISGVTTQDPDEPEFSAETEELASLASGPAEENPTPELQAAIKEARPLTAARVQAAKELKDAEGPIEDARSELASLKSDLKPLAGKEADLQREVEKAEQKAAEEAAFRAEATTIDYDQLSKDASDYKGTKVVYTGQIFQIQEYGNTSIILLSVTKEFGFWDDNIWVDAGEIASAEDDIITVYGTVTGSKTYQTQIGGSTYVPRVKAEYIDE